MSKKVARTIAMAPDEAPCTCAVCAMRRQICTDAGLRELVVEGQHAARKILREDRNNFQHAVATAEHNALCLSGLMEARPEDSATREIAFRLGGNLVFDRLLELAEPDGAVCWQ